VNQPTFFALTAAAVGLVLYSHYHPAASPPATTPFLFGSTMVANSPAIGCTNETLFRELMITASKDGSGVFLTRAISQVDKGNCRFFSAGQKVIVEEQELIQPTLIHVHPLAESGSYWTGTTFFDKVLSQ
jgi:hypothetical protein